MDEDGRSLATGVTKIRELLQSFPNIRQLLSLEDEVLKRLARAWNDGATNWAQTHPLVAVLFGEAHEGRRALGALALDGLLEPRFRQRVTAASRADYADVVAAITELLTAGALVAQAPK